MTNSISNPQAKLLYHKLPKQVARKDFNRYIASHLSHGKRGPQPKLSYYKIFNYILYVLHTGIQWNQLRPRKNEIHWSKIYMISRYELQPVIKPNPRNTKDRQKLKALQENFDEQAYKERYKIERCFAWEDVYRKTVIRYERLQCTHLGFKYLAYSMINLRWFVGKK